MTSGIAARGFHPSVRSRTGRRSITAESVAKAIVTLAGAALLLAATAIQALAQRDGEGAIRGRVTDSAGVGIASAILLPSGARLATYSGSGGAYVLSRLPAGTYTVSVKRLGFATDSFRVTLRANETIEHDV
ncbi:MAG: carboxypeptidase-like regulatory domain-containing protein, partial [bacterium]